MHTTVQNLNAIENKINEIIKKKQLKTNPKIIAVTKTFSLEKITPLLESGHQDFGENKVQEAEEKWKNIKNNYSKIRLHMIGKLQSNKAKKAVELFDYIHSLDSSKLAIKIKKYEEELNKKIKMFIQVNIGEEQQKSGIMINQLENFYNYCKKELSLNIVGLLCLAPNNYDPVKYFEILRKNSSKFNLTELSMGMSSDYENAVLNGSTFLRIGTEIFGERNT